MGIAGWAFLWSRGRYKAIEVYVYHHLLMSVVTITIMSLSEFLNVFFKGSCPILPTPSCLQEVCIQGRKMIEVGVILSQLEIPVRGHFASSQKSSKSYTCIGRF